MRKTIFIGLISAIPALSQVASFETIVDLQLGKIDAPTLTLVSLDPIQSAAVFARLPTVSMCPTDRGAEFNLQRINPGKNVVVEHISSICPFIDSVSIDTSAVYLVKTSKGKSWYLRMLERLDMKARIRLTSEIPPGTIEGTSTANDSEDFESVLNLDYANLSTNAFTLGKSDWFGIPIRHIPGPAVCPTTERWELELERVNPGYAGSPLSRMVSAKCVSADSLGFDPNLVYRLHLYYRGEFYLRIVGNLSDHRLRLALTRKMPNIASIREKTIPYGLRASVRRISRYRLDGRITSHHRIGPQ